MNASKPLGIEQVNGKP